MRQIADGDRVQRQTIGGIEGLGRFVDLAGGNDPVKLTRCCALVPLADRGKTRVRILRTRIKIERRVKGKLAADQTAGVIARGIIIVRAQGIRGALAELPRPINADQTDLRAPALLALTDYHACD